MEKAGETVFYDQFDLAMGAIFHRLRGSSTAPLEQQIWWPEVEGLRQIAAKQERERIIKWLREHYENRAADKLEEAL